MALALAITGCSLPQAHDPNLERRPEIPYHEEAVTETPLSEGSLWQDRLMVSDLRARRLNDLLTIRITESTTATSKADVDTSRAGSNALTAPTGLAHIASLGDSSTTSTYKGAGTTDRSAAFTTTVTARVVKVLGNGNLIFEGFRDIQLNNEKQRLYVAGMVNPVFLDVNNSIASGQVAELKVGYGGQGVVDETLKPGYISRLLAYIWPF
jgi:flagellar L-ring protein precursor FlgH